MGTVIGCENIQYAEDKFLYVYWNVGDGDHGSIDETYGYEIEVEEYNRAREYWNVINIFSFGYEAWSEKIWDKWGVYVLGKLDQFEKSDEGYMNAVDWLESINCMYTRDEDHLRDLMMIKDLLDE